MISKNDLKLFSVQSGAPIGTMVGQWRNELDSLMTIDNQDASGLFSGKYESKVSGSHERATGSLTGFVAEDTIGWVVNWEPKFNSTTSWSGKILAGPDGSPFLYTLWNLSRGVKDASDWWQSFLNGSDRFWRLGA